MQRLKNPKLIASLVVTVLSVVMFWQNSGEIQLNVLFLGSITTRKATALALAFLVGMIVGALAFSRWRTQREKVKPSGTNGGA